MNQIHPPFTHQVRLNVAATCPETRTLGPGRRAALWLQGCPQRCPGCISPEWQSFKPARILTARRLLDELLRVPHLDGLTISGGEPFAQAPGLLYLLELLHAERPQMNVICYSGFTLAQLLALPPESAQRRLLKAIDVLIDGPYRAAEDDLCGLRGSRNQRIWHFTTRLAACDFENGPRSSEFHVLDGRILMVGLPAGGVMEAFEQAVECVQTSAPGVAAL